MRQLSCLSVMCLVISSAAFGLERHVPSEYATIQAAIDACVGGDLVIIEPNTYTGDGNRDLDFLGKAITVRGTKPNDPQVVAATVIDCQGSPGDPHRGFNFHNNEGANSLLSGLTITGGYAPDHDAGSDGTGPIAGGVICWNGSSPTISQCVITRNSAVIGGGIVCTDGSSPVITKCIISENSSTVTVGGILCAYGSDPVIRDCTIQGNSTDGWAGGIDCVHNSNPTIVGCTIVGNKAAGGSGGIFCFDSSPTISNCLISGNSGILSRQSSLKGGGISCFGSSPRITNCTIVGNLGGDVAGGVYSNAYPGAPILTNCVIWGNSPTEIESAACVVTFSNVQGGWPGEGNIDANPCLRDPNGSDGDPHTWEDNDFHLTSCSPCINAGDPNGDYSGQKDIDSEPRSDGNRVDMGSDEVYCKLTITKANDPLGGYDVDPYMPGYVYSVGTEVTIHAIPPEGKSFKFFRVFDPNHPDDANYATDDANNPILFTMDSDRKVQVCFKCGSGLAPLLPVIICLLGSFVVRWKRQKSESI